MSEPKLLNLCNIKLTFCYGLIIQVIFLHSVKKQLSFLAFFWSKFANKFLYLWKEGMSLIQI